jgi:molecular chaperone DnaJ
MGSVRRAKKMTVKVPAGIDDGQTISRQGAGNAGANGGPAGDLLITVIVRPHAIFERDGTSILMEQDISFTQAALGAEVEVPTLDGKVKLTIPEGTQPGAVFRLKGKGVPYRRGSGRGDQFVSVNVRIPKNMNSTQKEALRHYAETMGEEHSKGSGIFGKKKR